MTFSLSDIDPIVFHVYGPFSITWYSLSYVAGIILGWVYFKKINHKYKLCIEQKFIEDIVTYVVIGIILGGRLGYVLFYDLEKYMANPNEILKTWKGGMSFHGGVIGLIFAIYLASLKYKISFIRVMDVISCVAPIGIFFGRIANFINGELFGKITNMPWGVYFKNSEGLRHPSQIYEAFLEGIVILVVQYLLLSKTKIITKPGLLCASFLFQYAVYRSIIEFFREPDDHIGYIGYFTMGQILSFPFFIASFILIIKFLKKNNGTKV